MRCTLDRLKQGQSAIVVGIDVKEKARKRHILDMGLTKGTNVKIKRISPMGDPVCVELRDYELCLSRKELQQIFIETDYRMCMTKKCKGKGCI